MTSPVTRRLARTLWTDDRHTRIRLQRSMLSFALYLECALGMGLLTRWGMLAGRDILAWTAWVVAGMGGFYALIRSGWSRRLADPSMSVAQIAFGLGSGVFGYWIGGAARSATLMPLFLIMIFGAFSISQRQMVVLTGLALAALAATMLARHARHAGAGIDVLDLSNFVMVAIVLPGIAMVTILLGRLRKRMAAQREELRAALARIQQLATLDELTGLANRRRGQELLAAEAARAQRDDRPFAVALVDLDHFKRLNDRFGHAGGDEALRRFALEARAALREVDAIARWGGEEFLVLMPGAAEPEALAALERLRARVAALVVPAAAGPMRFTLSAGVAQHGAAAVAETVARADRALYRAKALGRDRVEAAGLRAEPPVDATGAIRRLRSNTAPCAPAATAPSQARPAAEPDGSPAAGSTPAVLR